MPTRAAQEALYREQMDDEALARQKREAATKCKSCGAPIIFGKTGSGKFMPLDYDEHEGGNVFYFKRDNGCYVGKQDDPTPVDATRHYSHFASCPNAGKHRQPRLGEDVQP